MPRPPIVMALAFAMLACTQPVAAQDGLGFRFAFGQQSPGGELGIILNKGTDAEFSVLKPVGPFRVGAGANWVSFDVDGADASWSQVGFHGLVGYPFRVNEWLRPYAEARVTFRRLRPEDDRFFGGADELLRDFVTSGSGFEGVLGAEIDLAHRVALDVSGSVGSFNLSPDLSDEGFPDVDAGSAWRFHVGLSWFPMRDRATGRTRDGSGQPVWRDAWGQEKNFGLAVAEAWAGNFLPWTFNETVSSRRELKISQLSPRSWWRNIEEGWKWDDNAFGVNLFAHPLQGSMYYNAARSNGYGYWTALAFATAGSFNWECCGETHLMSINDWVNTSLGGAAVGEVFYRATSMILDNQATGANRKLRELATFLLSPTRGFARLMSGNAGRVYDNPSDPRDYRPEQGEAAFVFGMRGGDSRRTARGGSLDEPLDPHGFISAEVTSGSIAELERSTPFDWFTLAADVNFIRGRPIGALRIKGSLWHRDFEPSGSTVSKLVIVQDFEYENNTAFEQGGQGASLLYFREQNVSERMRISASLGPKLVLMGGVKSEFAFLADVEGIRERFREYDFGTGGGLRAELRLDRNGHNVFEGSWRGTYLKTLNGSSLDGEGSNHFVQTLRLRGVLPVSVAGFSLGADFERFHRRSNFEFEDIGVVNQKAELWRIFLKWVI